MSSDVVNEQPGAPKRPQQPAPAGWMALPTRVPVCPSGLEYLTMVDTIVVKQLKEMFEILTGFETKNKYVLTNSVGERVYFAFEQSDLFARMQCGRYRPFTMHILDNMQREVLMIHRDEPISCANSTPVNVISPVHGLLGTITNNAVCCELWSKFSVWDAHGQIVLTIDFMSCCESCGCGDKVFPIKCNGQQIGAITKLWGGCCKEYFTDADTFNVTFPMDLDASIKALLIGAAFMIDFMAFESSSNNGHGGYMY